MVIEQLEQERGVASKRARRLQDELQKVQQVTHPFPSISKPTISLGV